MKKEYIPTIGLEIHVQLATQSKMFCRCDNNAEGKEPNTVVCPLCMGFPGVLPVGNSRAIEYGVKTALALGCEINKFQRFDRKNYFYPDLPKAYQISQFFFPVGEHGKIAIDYLAADRKSKSEFSVGITRLHLEEDAGKLIHNKDATLVDFNRCGTPLMEIVTEPDITTPADAKAFMQELQRVVRSMGVSFADMEKGHLRVDANVSVRPKGAKELGTKIEVKNMNSFKFMEQALKYEIDRQIAFLEAGEKLQQETRGWDEKTGTTILQRVKEGSIDYRYFPEPDLPPIVLEDKQINEWAQEVTAELPSVLRAKAEATGLSYERVCELQDSDVLSRFLQEMQKDPSNDPEFVAKFMSPYVNTIEMVGYSGENNPDQFGQFVGASGYSGAREYSGYTKLPDSAVRQLFEMMAKNPSKSVRDLRNELKLIDNLELKKIVQVVMAENPDVVKRYQAGETKLIGFLTGQIMKQAGKGADPSSVAALLNKLLTE